MQPQLRTAEQSSMPLVPRCRREPQLHQKSFISSVLKIRTLYNREAWSHTINTNLNMILIRHQGNGGGGKISLL